MSARILLCADSFGLIDAKYPGLHFSEKITNINSNVEFMNFSMGGASNSLIELQIRQGLQFNPTHVIVLFTDSNRLEYSLEFSPYWKQIRQLNQYQNSVDWVELYIHNYNNYITSAMLSSGKDDFSKQVSVGEVTFPHHLCASMDYIKIKNYFIAINVISLLKLRRIPFCFSTGGLCYQWKNINATDATHQLNQLLIENGLHNEIDNYLDHALSINLWNHGDHTIQLAHHVSDHDVQLSFAKECMKKLGIDAQTV
jgi:hypothetical protein